MGDSGATHPKGQGVVGIKVVLRDLSVGLQGTWGVDGEAIRCRYLGDALEDVENVATTLSQALTPQLEGVLETTQERERK